MARNACFHACAIRDFWALPAAIAHCPISQASLHGDTAWPGRGDDAANSPPAALSAVRDMSSVVMIMSLSQWQSQCNGHDHDRDHGMAQAATNEPARDHSRVDQMRFCKTLQVSVCDLPVPAGFLLPDARPGFPATSTPSPSTLDGTIPSLDTWMARNACAIIFDTPHEGRTAPTTPLPPSLHHPANTCRATAITFARLFSRQPTHTKANGPAQRHSPTFIILPSTHASHAPSQQIDTPHKGRMARPNATPLPSPSRQHTPRDRDRLCEHLLPRKRCTPK
ncbi:hypothetical protein F5148DRAFT_318056 [Russula earlei]|uniref:Uncharacterized protein n=1 Tax=Russula earlei TaxID=71964 RepID=A0ACC0U3M6_9AGAM|nr:hypothetical protein F5148DRAFT_318056 [Russula earlei]